LPELPLSKGVTQSLPHQLDVFEHTLLAVERLGTLLNAILGPDEQDEHHLAVARAALAPFAPYLAKHLARPTSGGRHGRMLLYLAALLHDVGKPGNRSVDQDGRIRFLRHEGASAEMAQRRGRKLALSNDEVQHLSTMVRHHMRPAWLARCSADPAGRLTRRVIYRFFRDTGCSGLDVCMLCLADGLARGAPPEPAEWDRLVQSISHLIYHYLNRHGETISPTPLLGGRELMSTLNIPAGPEVGHLLGLIREAQAAGEISTAAGALALAREAHRSSVDGEDT
jgi:poly(A) polymerase